MKTPKWTEADAKRAAKMGWFLNTSWDDELATISKHGDRFKSDDEAIEWVMDAHFDDLPPCSAPEFFKTCRKAMFLMRQGLTS